MRMFLLATLLLAACGKKDSEKRIDIAELMGSAPTDTSPEMGGTFVWGRGADSDSLDPANVTDGESVTVITNIFDTLYTFKPGTTELEPSLARSYKTDGAQLVWTFELRDDVTFHDGTPMNADAVVFSFMRQMDPRHPARKPEDQFVYFHNNFKSLEKVEAIGEFVVRFTLKEPYAPFLAALALFNCSIVSPAAFKTGKDFARNPVGTGPFVFKEWQTDVRIVLEANPLYWGGRPYLDKLIFRPIPDSKARRIEVAKGSLSGMDNPEPTDLGKITADPNLRLLSKPGINVCYLAMNTEKKPFNDMRVRQAVAWAIDKERLIEAAYDGIGEPAVTLCPKTMIGFNDRLVDRKPNLSKARKLLAEAGLAGGFETTLSYMANARAYLPNPSTTAIQIQQDLKAIGIRVTLNKMDWSAYLQATRNGEHDMCILGWMADIFDPDNFLYMLLDKDNAVKGKANNVSFYKGGEVHRRLLAAQRSNDWSHRKRLYHEVQELVFDECPVVPLVTMPDFRVLRREVRGYTIYPAGGEFFHKTSLAPK